MAGGAGGKNIKVERVKGRLQRNFQSEETALNNKPPEMIPGAGDGFVS
jgi:hypothetical protein